MWLWELQEEEVSVGLWGHTGTTSYERLWQQHKPLRNMRQRNNFSPESFLIYENTKVDPVRILFKIPVL